ncbi:hypothetical protein B0A49_01309 [Cryomyces minteri]|uniref:CENP-V/GFA domain-containing protein n=1 Tax=Cryomyces minteri TaxID=331657 RepID=A0A4U0XRY6_9PEZI|nr:hypothetical protein B0A49_01309 [Cryomyces minteri]
MPSPESIPALDTPIVALATAASSATFYMTLLPIPAPSGNYARDRTSVLFCKCNCTISQKIGYPHTRMPSSPDDFVLLSPADLGELGDYTCGSEEKRAEPEKRLHFYFCKTCGVRYFSLYTYGEDEGEVVDLVIGDSVRGVGEDGEGNQDVSELSRAWKCKKESWIEDSSQGGQTGYLSIGAHTIEPDQEGFDLVELGKEKKMKYLDGRNQREKSRYDCPHTGGTW